MRNTTIIEEFIENVIDGTKTTSLCFFKYLRFLVERRRFGSISNIFYKLFDHCSPSILKLRVMLTLTVGFANTSKLNIISDLFFDSSKV